MLWINSHSPVTLTGRLQFTAVALLTCNAASYFCHWLIPSTHKPFIEGQAQWGGNLKRANFSLHLQPDLSIFATRLINSKSSSLFATPRIKSEWFFYLQLCLSILSADQWLVKSEAALPFPIQTAPLMNARPSSNATVILSIVIVATLFSKTVTPRCLAPPFPARSLKIMRRWRRQDQRDVKQ